MSSNSNYQFGEFTLNVASRAIKHKGIAREPQGKIFDFLLLLLSNNGDVVTKDTILDTLWPDQFVSEASVSRLVSDTRQLLATDEPHTEFIQTIRGKGFRFTCPVLRIDNTLAEPTANRAVERINTPQRWSVVVVFLLAVVAIMLWLQQQNNDITYSVDLENRVIVLPVEVQTGDVQDSWAEYGVMSMLTQQLREFENIQVADVDSVLSGINLIPYSETASAAEKYALICEALGCDTLLIPALKVEKGQLALSYQIIQQNIQSPEFIFNSDNVMDSARQLITHAVDQLVPPLQERLELSPLYSNNHRANMQFALGVNALYHSDFVAAEQAILLAINLQDDFFWAQAYLAQALYGQGRFLQAESALNGLSLQNQRVQAQLFAGNLTANIDYAKGNLADSIDVSIPLIEIARTAHEYELQGMLLMNTGTSYSALGDIPNAIAYLHRAIAVFQTHALKIREAQARLNLGNALHLRDPFSLASAQEYEVAATLFRQFQASAYLAYAMTAQAQYKRSLGRVEEAKSMILEVEQLYNAAGDTEGQLFVQLELADIALAQNDWRLALEHAELAHNRASDVYTYVRSYSAAIMVQIYLVLNELSPIDSLIAEQEKYQWFDPRPSFSLLKASYAHKQRKLDEAVDIATAVKQRLATEWTPKHQAYLDIFVEDATNGKSREMDYLQGQLK